jgi:hypothetical protein
MKPVIFYVFRRLGFAMWPGRVKQAWSALPWRGGAWLVAVAAGLVAAVEMTDRPEVAAPRATANADGLSADLALYRDLVEDVRQGQDYYAAARVRIAGYGFPVDSPLNWRLPTTAWLLAALPSLAWGQGLLAGLSLAAMALALGAWGGKEAAWAGWLLVGLWAGVLRWALDGHAFLAQEPWAATLVAGSLAASQLGHRARTWPWLSVALGTGALLVRELALPFCAVMAIQHWAGREGKLALAWTSGIGLFLVYYAWHLGRIHEQWVVDGISGGAGVSQWLRLGGLGFVLRTLRMNGWLFAAPAWLLWLYLALAAYGLAQARTATTQAAAWAVVLYLLAFAVLGRPENLYWGLVPAPLLAVGAAEGARRLAPLGSPAGFRRGPAEPKNLEPSAAPSVACHGIEEAVH